MLIPQQVKEAEKIPSHYEWTPEMYRDYFPGMSNDPGMQRVLAARDSPEFRAVQLMKIPMWQWCYKEAFVDGIDFLFLRGKYANEYKNANAHLDGKVALKDAAESKVEAKAQEVAAKPAPSVA